VRRKRNRPLTLLARPRTIMRIASLQLSGWFVTSFVILSSVAHAQNWPSFRGPQGTGVAADARPPITWNVGSSTHVVWRTAIPGLGHSSPVVWGDRVYVTTAAADAPAAQSLTLGDADRAGIDPANDMVPHRWQVMALDRATGKVVWTRGVYQGIPRVKRHVKGSHASATPATDGRVLVAMLGSEGLIAFDMTGAELWRKDLGRLSVGLADDPTYEWGPASSPVIHGNAVLVQNDRYRDSYLIAFDLQTGKELWRSPREELPSWATPLVHSQAAAPTIVTNSPRFIRGHDLATGRERWRVEDPKGEVKMSTPVSAGDLAIVTGGYPPAGRPIYAIQVRDGSLAWQLERGSPYTTTPLVYDGLLYIVTDNGILSAYQLSDGARVYQQRLARDAGSFSASPVAADGRIYLASEDGQIYVVRAGRAFELLATNDMKEVCMATPALSGELLLVRTKSHLYALRARN
jgi:outer membrane protein assembly factor BamB